MTKRHLTRAGSYSIFMALATLLIGVALWNGAAYDSLSQEAQMTPQELKGVVESIGVFKNGVAAVVERYEAPGVGEYVVATAPQPLHGTFFVQSDAVVEASADVGNVELDLAEVDDFDWTKDLNGQWFQVVLPGETELRKVRAPFGRKGDATAIDFPLSASYAARAGIRNGVFLETEDKEMIWIANPGEINKLILPAGAAPQKVARQRSRLRLKVKSAPNDKNVVVTISYLTKGVCWAPQYCVTLKDDKRLEIEQNALLVNEWREFSTDNLTLYSGFPRILFKDALSPIDPTVTLANYFASLNGGSGSTRMNNAVLTQQAVFNNAVAVAPRQSGQDYAIQDGAENQEGVDVYSTKVGAKSLSKNERALFLLGRKAAEYKRVVYWNISDSRDDRGNINPAGGYAVTTSGESALEYVNRFTEPWDVLEFNNPFNWPITTGPATTTSNGSFLAQDMFYWTNPGERTLLPITKSLSVKVRSVERERDLTQAQSQANFNPAQVDPKNFADFNWVVNEQNWGRFFVFRGINYRIAVYDAEITINNTRNEKVEMRLSRQYTGLALQKSFEGFEPEITQLGHENSWEQFVNRRCEMKWVTALEPGERKVLKFTYLRLIHQ